MRIAVDWDETITMLSQHIIDVVSSETGIVLPGYDQIKWGSLSSDPRVISKYGDVYNNIQVVSTTPIYPGAVHVVKRLCAHHNVAIVTASALEAALARVILFGQHFTFMSRHQFIVASDKSWISADLIIDDNPTNLRRSGDILMRRPWNTEFQHHYVCVDNWVELEKILEFRGWLPSYE